MEEYLTLSNEEKRQAIRSRIKNLQYTKYNIEVSLAMENSVNEPNQYEINSLTNQLQELESKEQALLLMLGELV